MHHYKPPLQSPSAPKESRKSDLNHSTSREPHGEKTRKVLLYAKPIRTETQRTEHEVKKQQSDLTDDSTTEQSYNNPAFYSGVSDGTTSPTGDDLSTPIKPTAMVRPTRPSKPRPYKPKPAERGSSTRSTHDDRMVPSSSPPASVNDGNPSLENIDDCPYAQASVPMRQQSSHGNPEFEDHIVYAKLDLQSDEIHDGGRHPEPAF